MTTRPFNFAAGPSTLPEAVLSRAAQEMLDWHDSGMSVMEMTHRGTVYLGLFEKVMADFRRLLRLPDHYKILLMQGGATAQNALIPMNLMGANRKLDYVNTGHWSTKSINEARSYGDVHVAASSQDLPAAGAVPSPFFPFTFIPQYSEWRVRA